MKKLGVLLLSVGFVGGSYFLVVQRESVHWMGYVPMFVLALAGIIMMRVSSRKAQMKAEHISANIQNVDESLKAIVEKMTKLDEEKKSLDVYDIPALIDERFMDDVEKFVDARESMSHAYGLPAYAEIMSHFATAERHMNRVWSCASDGYIDEAHKYITLSKEQFVEAKTRLDGHR